MSAVHMIANVTQGCARAASNPRQRCFVMDPARRASRARVLDQQISCLLDAPELCVAARQGL